MSAIINKIKKRVTKLNNALQILEKNLSSQEQPNSVSRPFDLTAQVEYDAGQRAETRRKERNKRKAERRSKNGL
jgi:hypothetical protein